uniref:Uncharacterized protein n=1 Tax=Kwoniella dejecticola CBS 10117 TaxID=1296121 RepID=A0A1A6AFV8_9TREE|nr:uncharacterized protein I303_00782 [Kwoniella dejecticola CBS 10117]OBR88962.1 hypothetical protein I303_00782 [Kwoniella dejecticola CBS 10117]
MPLQTRRPNLPSLSLPGPKSSLLMVEDVHTPHTPNPFTPLPFEQGPMVMTPDTPSFDMKPLEIVLGEKKCIEPVVREPEGAWTEEEDGLLQSYLAHPPRALRNAYPPGTLPPPSAIDEITTHLITSEIPSTSSSDSDSTPKCTIAVSSGWRHSWTSTRQRLFDLARKESMDAIGGHRRKISDSIIPPQEDKVDAVMKPQRPRLAVLGGGQKMNRQQHSMDSLYGDEKPQTFQEALRLSSNLQVNAQGTTEELHSGSGLSSPLTFSFNLPTSIRKPFPFSAPSTFMPRPASLLQRGRSFTSEDFAREHAKANGDGAGDGDVDDFALDDIDNEPRPQSPTRIIRPEIIRSVSSPASTLYSSPPSSISSQCEESETSSSLLLDIEMTEDAPITPVNQTFSGLQVGGPLGSQCSTPTVSSTPLNPPPIAQPSVHSKDAPSITLTINSPERPSSSSASSTAATASSSAYMDMDRSTSPSEAFSNLSLGYSHSLPLKLPFTSSPMSMGSRSLSLGLGQPPSSGVKRSLRPASLGRSLSDSGTSRSLPSAATTGSGGKLTMTSLSCERDKDKDRENKRQRAIAGMKFGGHGLSVIVPKRNGLLEELRSPFEIKKSF